MNQSLQCDLLRGIALTALLGVAAPAAAEQVDCTAATAPVEATLCAAAGSPAVGDGPDGTLGPVEITREQGRIRLTQSGPAIEIEASMPVFPGDSAAARAGELALAAQIKTLVLEFRDMYRDLLSAGDGGHVGAPWTLNLDYEQVHDAPRFWAVDHTIYRYTGGAHGSTEQLPMVIAKSDGGLVEPSALFRTDSDWLTALADYCYRALAQKPEVGDDDEWLRGGTAANADNYQHLLPLADGLHVIFEQYQIGPYAIGIHTVVVPYERLGALLNPALFERRDHP